jgi:hypothetical protein
MSLLPPSLNSLPLLKERAAILVSNIAKAIDKHEIQEYLSYFAQIDTFIMFDCPNDTRKKAIAVFKEPDTDMFADWDAPGGLSIEYINEDNYIDLLQLAEDQLKLTEKPLHSKDKLDNVNYAIDHENENTSTARN